MIDRDYFEAVLSDQIRIMEGRVQMELSLADGRTFDVWSLIAAHDAYVVLEVHPQGELKERTEAWQDLNPTAPPWVFDQLAVPYHNISSVYLKARPSSSAGGRAVGFREEGPE